MAPKCWIIHSVSLLQTLSPKNRIFPQWCRIAALFCHKQPCFFFLYIHKHIIVDLVWSQGDNTFPSCDSEKSLLTAPEFWGWVSVSIETFPKWSNSQKLLSIRGFLRKQLVARARDLWFDFSSWHSLLCRMHEVKSNSTIFKTKCEMSEIRLSMGENEKLSLYRSTGVACLSLFSSTRYGCRNV